MPSAWRESCHQAADAAEANHAEASCRGARDRCDSEARGHSPAATAAVEEYQAPRRSSIAVAITYSATASALAPVAGITSMPRAAQSAVSMLSRPTPSLPTTDSRGAAARSAASTSVRLRDDQRIGIGEPRRLELPRRSTSRLS